MTRSRNHGLRKICGCRRATWPKCPHSWYFNFTWKGEVYRLGIDKAVGRRLASKTEAETQADEFRAQIRAGTFRQSSAITNQSVSAGTASPSPVSLDTFIQIFLERSARASGKVSWKNDRYMLARLAAHQTADGRRLGTVPLTAITEDELEASFSGLQAAGRAASTRNQYVQVIKAAFRWAAKKCYLARSPLSDDSILKRTKHAQRSRRLFPDEEGKLFSAAATLQGLAGPRMRGLIVAALETGCRQGELLNLQWSDVSLTRRELLIRAVAIGARKTRRPRLLPISDRLAGVFEMARTDPAGREYPAAAYIFGALGARVKEVKKAWETTVLRAHGRTVEWRHGNQLAAGSRAAYREIDLHFHDLRHEAGSAGSKRDGPSMKCATCWGTQRWTRQART